MKKILYILLLVVSFFSCEKEKLEIGIRKIDSGVDYRINDIYFLNQQKGFAVGGDRYNEGYILKTEDGGKNWTRIPDSLIDADIDLQTLNSIDFFNDSIGEIVGHGGKIVRTIDGGKTWVAILNGTWSNFYDIKMFNATKTLLVTGGAYENGSFFKTNEDWYTFDREDFLFALRDLEFVNNQIGFAAGYGFVQKTIDGGNTWETLELKGDFFFNMDFIDDKNGYICGWQGGIFKTTDGGANWRNVHPVNQGFSTRHHFENIDFIDKNTGLVCSYDGNIFYTEDGGKKWKKIITNTKTNFHSIYFLNENTAFAGGSEGVFLELSF